MSTNQIEGADTLATAEPVDQEAARTAVSPLPPLFTGKELAAEQATERSAEQATQRSAEQSAEQDARQNAVRQLFGTDAPEPELSGTGFSYRHDWGSRRGQWILRLNWGAINPVSRVLVSIAEGAAGGPDAGKFIGAARYTVHNVAPRDGGVDIWVNIEWDADIPLYVDYLIINP